MIEIDFKDVQVRRYEGVEGIAKRYIRRVAACGQSVRVETSIAAGQGAVALFSHHLRQSFTYLLTVHCFIYSVISQWQIDCNIEFQVLLYTYFSWLKL